MNNRLLAGVLTALLLLTPAIGAAQHQDPVVVREATTLPKPGSLKYPVLREVKIPKPTVVVLRNGMKVFLLEDHELPVVRGTALIRTGNLFDPDDKRGLATLTGITIRSGGTNNITGDKLDEALESMAASVESSIDESFGTLRFRCLKENVDAVLGYYFDTLTSPVFDQSKIDLAKTQLRSGISRRNDDAGGIANRELLRLLYGPNTPYGGQEEYATIQAVTQFDISAFYKRYYFPSNIGMVVYGDFSTADMQQKLERLTASWTPQQEKVPPFPTVTNKPQPGVYFVEKEDVEQTFLEIGDLGGELSDKDYPALSVAADILGSGFSSRLMREVRSRLGYAYSIGADWQANYDHPGLFRIGGSARSEVTTKTVSAILEQVSSMRTDPVSDQELKTAKDTVLNSVVFDFERPSQTLGRLLTYDYFGYPGDFLTKYQEAVSRVTKEDILRVAKAHFAPDKLLIVAVGNSSKFQKPLSDLHMAVKTLDVSIPPPPADGSGDKSAGLQ